MLCEALLPPAKLAEPCRPLLGVTRALQSGRRWPRDSPECPQDAQRGHQEDAQGVIKIVILKLGVSFRPP